MRERRKHSAQIKFQIAIQAVSRQKAVQEISREYDINPNLVTKWKKKLEEEGYRVFETKTPEDDPRKRISELESIIGKKEVEIQLLKKYLGFYAQGWPNG